MLLNNTLLIWLCVEHFPIHEWSTRELRWGELLFVLTSLLNSCGKRAEQLLFQAGT